MVNHQRKTAKKAKRTSNITKKDKYSSGHVSGSHRSKMTSDQEGQVPVVSSLPPAVDGHLRCFLRVSVPTIQWTINNYPTDVHVQIKWWGEEHGDGILFRPVDDNASEKRECTARLTSVRYAVCSGPRQFNAYLKDMGPLIFDVVHGPSLILMGQVRLSDVTQLSATSPVEGFFDVMSTSSPETKIALLYIALRFESTAAAYSQISSSIPTTDMEMYQQQRHASDESNPQPTLHPMTLSPAMSVTHPRKGTPQNTDPFMSPAIHNKGVKFALNSPERLEYTAEHSLISSPSANMFGLEFEGKEDDKEITMHSELLSPARDINSKVSSDLIGALLQRGEKLRDAMVMSADEGNDPVDSSGSASVVERNAQPGKLFKAILTSSNVDNRPEAPGADDSAVHESVFLHNNEAVDLVLGEEHVHYQEESPVLSPDSSIVSEPGDPLYDESLLNDLFYNTPAEQANTDSDHTEEDEDSFDEPSSHTEKEETKIFHHVQHKNPSPETTPSKGCDRRRKTVSSKQTSTDNHTHDPKGEHSPVDALEDSSFSSISKRETRSPDPNEFINSLGPEKLTALGRVDTARVTVDSVGINKDAVKGTYFIEYSFPSSTQALSEGEDIAMASELTRLASKRVQDKVVLFNHRSVFPVAFNSPVLDYWWRRPLTFRLYFRESGQRTPAVVGVATFPMRRVLQSDSLSSSASLQIKHSLNSKYSEPGDSSSFHHTSGPLDDNQYTSGVYGPLLVRLELMKNGKELQIKPRIFRKPPLPISAPSQQSDHILVTKPVQFVGQVYDVASHSKENVVKPSDKSMPQISVNEKIDDLERDPLTVYTLLWIPEGSRLVQHKHHEAKDVPKGLVHKNNLYLVCRMFWCDEVTKSRVCWGDINPLFGFKQVAPVMLNSPLLQRICNNVMIIEVWNRIGPHDHADQLLGLVKLPLHQLYLSYRDPKITKTLLKSKYPVIAVDEWSDVVNPFTRTHHGQVKVLLAMGSEEQISAILNMKCGGEIPVGLVSHPAHQLDIPRFHDNGNKAVNSTENEELVEHQFEITVEDIRGLSVFGSTLWGETDCFVQYHFPFQRLQQQHSSQTTGQDEILKLQPHRTHTTLCVPDPSFHDVARHAFKLPLGIPVQKHLLAAFTGSWVSAPSVLGSGGVPFELWRRFYYPNIRDQMVAKASLPLAKLCAMVTMQKQGEATIQSFSLPLTVIAGDEINSLRQSDRVPDTGLLDVTLKYQHVRSDQLKKEYQKEEIDHVCLSLKVVQACGLKAAARVHAKSMPSLSYPAEVGVNCYVVIQFPLGKRRKHVTKAVARTFTPEFSYDANILLPILMPSGATGKGKLSLAEQLEDSEMLIEVWHQMSRGKSTRQVFRLGDKASVPSDRDVLLGESTVPLLTLLTRQTGIKGWYPINMPSDSEVHGKTTPFGTGKAVGGLELSLQFSEAQDRNHVLHVSRGVGWSPRSGLECDETDWLGKEEMPEDTNLEIGLKISKAWIPTSQLHSFSSGTQRVDRGVMAYARYKLYNKAPICSRMAHVIGSSDGQMICELKHSKDTTLPASPSLTWHMKEEDLEIQLWLSHRGLHDESAARKRDRLLGSAFVDLSSLVINDHRNYRQISGLYPLFRSGATEMFGAFVHVRASVKVQLEGDSHMEHASSDEHADISSLMEDCDGDRDTMNSSQEHMTAKITEDSTKEQQPVTDTTDDSFSAHVSIDQALHLPTVPGKDGQRTIPNVYVSYQTLASGAPSCTPVAMSSINPCWEFQKLERISYTTLKTWDLVFKLWHTPHDTDVLTKAQKSGEDSSSEDRLIGFVSFDLSPLLAGMRQLIGWYNVMDFYGDCKGQIKLGVSPVIPVSPLRCSTASRTGYLPSSKRDLQGTSYNTSSVNSPQEANDAFHQNIVKHRFCKGGKETAIIDDLPVCSTSHLFSQLRQNMKELDTLQQSLHLKLRSRSAMDDSNYPEGELVHVVVEPSRHLFSDISMETSSDTLKTDSKEVAGIEQETKPCGSESILGDTVGIHNNEHFKQGTSATPGTIIEMQNTANHVTDLRLPEGIGSSNPKNVLTSNQRLQCDKEGNSFFTLAKNSQVESQHLSIDSDSSVASDLSDNFSVGGDVKDNTKTSKFYDNKDSWLSSDEEGTLANIEEIEKLTFSSIATSEHYMEQKTIFQDANSTESNVHQQNRENDSDGDDGEITGREVDNPAIMCKVAENFSEMSTDAGTGLKCSGTSTCDFVEEVYNFENNQENLPRELPKHATLSSHHLPNFFMPTEQLEESMRVLRLGMQSNSSRSHSKLLSRSHYLDIPAKGNLTEVFAKREPIYMARNGVRPPISNSEAERIARIFNSGSM
ncbi:C2 domain-containing protein 3-like isoform X2 [Montipora capricornis]|uniref:C2 domain-containing protein 3-like isoform X2 n=1 Tax=Montipora capricornis TaxID=246305 RepID=UPI0035F173BC